MNTQELLKQADYTFQRGNRELAKKYLSEFLAAHPEEEAAWMLMARIVDEKERKIECYERAIKINPSNNEAKIGLVRIKSLNPALLRNNDISNIWQAKPKPYKNTLRATLVVVVVVFLFATTTLVVARNNPESNLAKMLTIATPALYVESIADDIAPQTRAQVSASYPQYAPLVDTLINFAVENANNGMEGAPERPGAEIMISEIAGMEAKTTLEKALPQPGTLASVTITEQQATSWLALGIKNNPDLPLSDVQVYLRNGKVQVWGMVNGNETSTSALIIGTISINNNNKPYFEIVSLQIGQQVVPGFLVSQAESWLNQSLAAEIDSQTPGLELMNINVTNGLITISGMR